MKKFKKTFYTSVLFATFLTGQSVLADSPDHNEDTSNMIMSHHKQGDVFGDTENHEGNAAPHSVGDVSHGGSVPHFTSAEQQAIRKLIFGNDATRK